MSLKIRSLVCIAFAGASLGSIVVATPALAQTEQQQYNIPAQDLSGALEAFGRHSGKEILFDRGQVAGKRSRAVFGTMAPDAALRVLLEGTGMSALEANRNTYVIKLSAETKISEVERDNTIIVTAQKRQQRMIDVPLPVSTVSAEELLDTNSTSVKDYYQRIPGLSLATSGNGNETFIAVRGITAGAIGNPTVGITIDDVPFGPSITTAAVPDIDPSNLSGIEVLRGPQGSLYGASSMGGLLKFVTVAPSTSSMRGSVQTGISGVDQGEDIGWSVRGDINMPLGNTLAIRTSGFYRLDPGYVDNVTTGEQDVNKTRAKGGNVSLLWEPSSAFSVRLGALIQNSRRAGSDEINLDLDEDRLTQNYLPFTGSYEQQSEVYSGVIKGNIGNVEVTSITAYNFSRMDSDLDVSSLYGGLYSNLANNLFGVSATSIPFFTQTKAFTQELRANVPIAPGIDWVVGGLIDHEKLLQGNNIVAFDTETGNALGDLVNNEITQKYRNYALFSNIDLTITDQFSVQVGGRISTNRQRSRTLRTGALIDLLLGVPVVDSGILKSSESPTTFSIAPQWKFGPNLMAYGRVATGYRPGGPNISCGNPGVPCTYGSDSTVNYEIGLKGDLLERLITIDTSIYLIDWKDIQTRVLTPDRVSGYIENGTRARSQGVEFSVGIRPSNAMKIDSWIAYNDSSLSEDFPASANLAAFDGDRLPYSSKWSGSVSAKQDFALTDRLDAYVGTNLSYVGKRMGRFQPTINRSTFPSYWQIDASAGLKWDDWRLNAYITNLTNERGVLRSGLDAFTPSWITYIRPRSFGIGISRTF